MDCYNGKFHFRVVWIWQIMRTLKKAEDEWCTLAEVRPCRFLFLIHILRYLTYQLSWIRTNGSGIFLFFLLLSLFFFIKISYFPHGSTSSILPISSRVHHTCDCCENNPFNPLRLSTSFLFLISINIVFSPDSPFPFLLWCFPSLIVISFLQSHSWYSRGAFRFVMSSVLHW